jgi:hypothetical protein
MHQDISFIEIIKTHLRKKDLEENWNREFPFSNELMAFIFIIQTFNWLFDYGVLGFGEQDVTERSNVQKLRIASTYSLKLSTLIYRYFLNLVINFFC